LTDHQLAIRLRAYAEIFNRAPPDDEAQRVALIETAADMLEAAKRLDLNYERQMAR
jgi:hypothetical protein